MASDVALEAVVFDWGGTLSLHVEVELLDLWRVAARRLDPAREEDVVRRLVAVEAASWARTRTTQRSARLLDLLREASDELELDVAEAVLEEAAASHLDAWTPSIRHDPDALPVLEALRERGLRIALLSNTHWPRAYHERFLDRDGLAPLIDARVYTSELDWVKPHPAVFAEVTSRLGVDAAACAFVGDRPHDDVRGARAAGMRAVWRRNVHVGETAEDADAVIDALPELLPVVDGWRG